MTVRHHHSPAPRPRRASIVRAAPSGAVERLALTVPLAMLGTVVAACPGRVPPQPAASAAPSGAASGAPQATTGPVTTVSGIGLRGPENLVYDAAADVYLVSNLDLGTPPAERRGFISRLAAEDGRVLALRWIQGGRDGVTLATPKGLAIRGDTLVVADSGAVRFFDRRTGAALGARTVPGIGLNDLSYAPDGALWITDTGPGRTHTPVDTSRDLDAVFRLMPARPDGVVQSVARGLDLDRPDGILAEGPSAVVTTFGADRLERVAPGRGKVVVATLPGGRVDGLRALPDGSWGVTSWDARTVWRLVPGAAPRPLLTGATSPAGVTVDTRRGRLAVSSLQGNAIYLFPLPQ